MANKDEKNQTLYELAQQAQPAAAAKLMPTTPTIQSTLEEMPKITSTMMATPVKSTTTTKKTTAQKAPTYAGTYEDQLAQLYDQIQNREAFSYDVNADPLYQNYKDQYIQGGKLAMQDTMGKAAALTGGYGSTYSQQAGQQTYDAYLQNLTAQIPELYNMAYGMYKDKGDELMQQYSMLGDLRNTEYNRYRDAMSDYNYNREFEAKQQQQNYSKIVSLIQSTGYKPTNKELEAAGMTRRQAEKLRKAYLKANKKTTAKSNGGGSGGNGGPKDDGKPGTYTMDELNKGADDGMTRAQIEAVLKKRGIDVTKDSVKKDIAKALSRQVKTLSR